LEATFYIWKWKYGQFAVSEMREIRQLRDENARLKSLVADRTLDKHMLSEVNRRQFEAGMTAADRSLN
jgi:putative transposase